MFNIHTLLRKIAKMSHMDSLSSSTISPGSLYQICGKICHDLAAPLSAITMALEMLEESQNDKQIRSLLAENTKSAIQKLELLRCLFGFAGDPSRPTNIDALKFLTPFSDPRKHTLNLDPLNHLAISGEPIRLILCLLLIAIEGCPRGGTITLTPDFTIHATGKDVKVGEETLDILTNKRTDSTNRQALALFGAFLANQLGAEIFYQSTSPEEFRLGAR